MNKNEICESLKSLGWRVATDEVGDKVAFFDLPDRIVDVIPDLWRVRGEQQLSISPTLSISHFCEICQAIKKRGSDYTPLARAWKSSRISSPEIDAGHVQRASEEAITGAMNLDLGKALLDCAALPTSAPGARPVWHLGALAVLGDVQRLKSYQASFEMGDRLGFVTYVTKDYIDRAVELAEQTTPCAFRGI